MFEFREKCITCLSEDRTLTSVGFFRKFFMEINAKKVIEMNGGVCWECQHIISKFNRFKQQIRTAQKIIAERVPYVKPLSKLAQHNKNMYDYVLIHNSDPLIYSELDTKHVKEESIDYDYKDDISTEDIYVDHIENKIIDEIEYNKVNNAKKVDENVNTLKIIDDNEPFKDTVDDSNAKRLKKENIIIISHNKRIARNNSNVINHKINVKQRKIKSNCRVKIKKEASGKIPPEDFEEKFQSVVLSEVEMVKSREEKRNQPNFKKIPYKCDSCVLGFLRKDNYDLHLVKKHDERIGPYSCSICDIRFPNQRLMERHKTKHYTVYRCKLCKYETVELWSAINHSKAKHSGDSTGSIHCSQCISVYKSPQELEEHVRKEHTLTCNECGGRFKGKNTLRSHRVRVHAFKREYSCELCKKAFNSQSRLESHMASHESSVARRLAYCSVCDVQYKNIYVYRNHLKNSANHADDLFPCSDCDKKFASKVYWRKHYEFYHLHKSRYICDICNKLFISAWRLKSHKQKYHGLTRPRDHSCNVCGKKFFTLPTLRGHMLTHSEERTYMCEDCGDTFKQRPALYTHSRLVHKGGRKVKTDNKDITSY